MPLAAAQWVVIGAYLAYLLPYVVVSYYDRYRVPVLGAEAVLLVWGIHRFLIGERLSPSDIEAVVPDSLAGARARTGPIPEGIVT